LLAITKSAPRTYTELQKELGINSKLVSSKIKELVALDVLKKVGDKYDLSKFGKKLIKKIKPLAKMVADFTDNVEKKIEKEAKEISKKVNEKI
jgi:predicted transcriptional regulator